jgi:drug/metabolite transporter (DMT)-like permease
VGYVQIAFAMAWGAAIFGERVDAIALAGAGLVVLGIAILVATQPRGPASSSEVRR